MIQNTSSRRSTIGHESFKLSATEIIIGAVAGLVTFVALMTLKNYLAFLIFH